MRSIIEKITKAGYRAFIYDSDKKPTWVVYGNDSGNVGYCQWERFRGYSFSSVHKPNRQTGTGFSILSDCSAPTIEDIEAAFAFAPHWASKSDCNSVKKYKGIAEYINQQYLPYKEVWK